MLYQIPSKGSLNDRIKAIIMTIVLVILFLFVILVPAFGDYIIKLITDLTSAKMDKTVILVFNILKYPVSMFIIYFFVKLLYTMAPDKMIGSKNTTVGAFLTAICWVITTEIYSFYVRIFAKYSLLYGSLANLIILLLWIYLLSFIFVLGMSLNSVTYKIGKEDK